jgi:hypothetical protein
MEAVLRPDPIEVAESEDDEVLHHGQQVAVLEQAVCNRPTERGESGRHAYALGGDHLGRRFADALVVQQSVGPLCPASLVVEHVGERAGRRVEKYQHPHVQHSRGPGLRGPGWMLSTQCTCSGLGSTFGRSRLTTTGSCPLRQSTHDSGSESLALISWCGTNGGM